MPASVVALLSARADTITDGGKTEGERGDKVGGSADTEGEERQDNGSADTIAISPCDMPCASHLVALL